MIRASALPIARFCGESPRLAARLNVAGRAAAMSTAFHAFAAGQPDWRTLWANLSEEERAEVATWVPPEPLKLPSGHLLRYEDAHKEAPCGLDKFGGFALEDAITRGTADMVWRWSEPRGFDWAPLVVVGDIKKSRYTTSDGPRSLQLLAYALAHAARLGATHYATAIWISEERRWVASNIVAMDGEQAADDWRAVKSAAQAPEGYNVGAHCRGCYARLQCPAHLMPVTETALAPLSKPGGITAENAARALLTVQALEDLAKQAKEQLKAFAREHGGIVDGDQVWRPITKRGAGKLDRDALETDHPGLLARYTSGGGVYEEFRWTKRKERTT